MKKNSLLAGVAMLALMTYGAQAQAGTVISNGTIALGVNDEGHLNLSGSAFPASLGGVSTVGLRFLPPGGGGYASTEPGCACEGWGAGIRSTGATGFANVSVDGVVNLNLVSFTSNATSATSKVQVLGATGAAVLEVTHEYRPLAGTPNLYQVDVSIKNVSGIDLAAGDLVYRRVMDWDVEPTAFSEFVTMQGIPALLGVANGNNIATTSTNGFRTANPLDNVTTDGSVDTDIIDANVVDHGPDDHGASFTFEFEALTNGSTRQFSIFYGAAATEAEADLARSLVDGDASDIEVGLYSYGQCDAELNDICSTSAGTPVTFIFGFGASGGILEPPPPPPPGTDVPVPGTLALLGAGLAGLGMARRRRQNT